MPKVTFKCPDHITANALALLAEEGAITELINEKLEKMHKQDHLVEEYPVVDFDDREHNTNVQHEVTLELA